MENIPFNQPFIAGKELYYIAQAVAFGKIAGDGDFSRKCASLLQKSLGSEKILLTPSCTSSLELAAMACDLAEGDEVIVPSYTFVSTVNAFVRQRAKPVFVDIRGDTMNIDEMLIEDAITDRTRAIFPVHYAGVSAEMDIIMDIADRHQLRVVEDAAQAVNSYYHGQALGTIGDFGCYSFHETKNFICGEGGAISVNREPDRLRSEILRDKGTNRQQFFRGEVDKYSWVDVGSSFVPSEVCSAFLYAQLEMMASISTRRREIYERYYRQLLPFQTRELLSLPVIPAHCRSNFHMFYILLKNQNVRDSLLQHLRSKDIHAVFHYVPLHSSAMGQKYGYSERDLPVTSDMSGRLLRLPFFHEITDSQQDRVVSAINDFFAGKQTTRSSNSISVPIKFLSNPGR